MVNRIKVRLLRRDHVMANNTNRVTYVGASIGKMNQFADEAIVVSWVDRINQHFNK